MLFLHAWDWNEMEYVHYPGHKKDLHFDNFWSKTNVFDGEKFWNQIIFNEITYFTKTAPGNIKYIISLGLSVLLLY